MASFSQRHGYAPADKALQLEAMDSPLRTAIWNAVHLVFFEDEVPHFGTSGSPIHQAAVPIWIVFLQQPADSMPSTNGAWSDVLKDFIYKNEWFRVYDLVEQLHRRSPEGLSDRFSEVLNVFLANERSGYRLVAGEVTPITATEEVAAISDAAVSDAGEAKGHIRKALRLFSDRDAPDYANSVKESISAVESACQHLLGRKVTAGDGLRLLKVSLGLHPALADGFSKLYGFTSDAGGIRHAQQAGSLPPTEAEARYFLVTCSAFVNYLIVKKLERGSE